MSRSYSMLITPAEVLKSGVTINNKYRIPLVRF